MKVLVADTFEPSGIAALQSAGCDVLYQPQLEHESLLAAIRDSAADVLVVRGTAVTAAMLGVGTLGLIVRAGAGYNTIDVAAASRHGIYVSNCPGKNAIAVAELTFALILALDRRLPDSVVELRGGRWNKKEFAKARGLFGRTLGLLGFGSIGQEVAHRAAAFGMPVLVWSRRFVDRQDIPEVGAGIDIVRSPGELAERADVLSIHLALTPETRGVVNAAVLGRLKPGSYVINTARGELVDHTALELAIRERGIRAGLDVFAGEPSAAVAEFTPSIVALPNVYGTHHVGASTEQAQEAIAAETVRVIVTYKNTGKVPNVVNLAKKTPATHLLTVRHRDRPGVLAHVFDRLRAAGINVQETENVIFEGAEAAAARIHLDGPPLQDLLAAIRSGNEHILDLQVVPV